MVVLALLVPVSAAWAGAPQPREARSYRPYPPIEVTSLVFDKPRPMRAWTVRIDLTSPDIELVATPRGNVGDKFETACATTLDFAKEHNVQLAINATPFSPFRSKPGQGMDLVGLGAHDGDIYSSPHTRYGALIVTTAGRVDIVNPPIATPILATIDEAVGGFNVLVRRGKSRAASVAAGVSSDFAGPNPRTAVGLSADGETMWMIVVDGRNRDRSEGMTIRELADFGVALGCCALLNMDGGGSTTLVLQDPASKQWRVVNQPVGRKILGTQRLVGNNLGIQVREPMSNNIPG